MNSQFWKELVGLSLREPRKAGSVLIGLPVERNALWLALALMAIMHSLLFSLMVLIVPPTVPMVPLFSSPTLYTIVLACGLVLAAVVLTFLGQTMGGQGTLNGVLSMLVWLQFLRLLAQVILMGMVVILPGLANIFAIAVGLYGLWILVNFLDVAHGFNSLGRAFLLLLFSGLGISFGLALILALIGAADMGLAANV